MGARVSKGAFVAAFLQYRKWIVDVELAILEVSEEDKQILAHDLTIYNSQKQVLDEKDLSVLSCLHSCTVEVTPKH